MEKIKSFIESEKGKDILIILIIILVGIASFLLGRLSKEGQNDEFKVIYPNSQANAISGLKEVQNGLNLQKTTNLSQNPISYKSSDISIPKGNFFASKRGKKYYTLGCSAGKTIKDENKVWFDTGEEAVLAGYELSSSCN